MRALLAVAALALALAPALALAQGTIEAPITCTGADGRVHNCGYTEAYVVSGRVIDAYGNPVVGASLDVSLVEKGVSSSPTKALTNCFGDFTTWFELQHVDPAGTVTVTLPSANGVAEASAKAFLDPFWRRSDLNLSWQGQDTQSCPDQTPLWPDRVTVTGRLLDRTPDQQVNGETIQATPYVGPVHLRFWENNTTIHCPPSDQPGVCEPIFVNQSRGDFRYSWVSPGPLPAVGRVEVMWGKNFTQSANFTMDPAFRYALAYIEGTGQGAPTFSHKAQTPAPGLALSLVAALAPALALVLRRRVLVRRPPPR